MSFSNTRKVRIEWGDCDPAGIIFYPRYFEIFDASTAALFERALGLTMFQMFKTFDCAGYPLACTRARFVRPTRYGDDVTVEIGDHIRPRQFRYRASHHAQGADLRRMFGDAGLGGERCGQTRQLQVASDSASGAGEVRCVANCRPRRRGDDSRKLLDLRRDLFQDLQEPLAVARADDAVEHAFMPARAARQIGERPPAGRRQIEPIDAPVRARAPAFDQTARTRSSITGVRLDLSRPLAWLNPVWLMPGLRAISVKVAKRPGCSPISRERRENAAKACSCAMRKLKPTQVAKGPNLIDSAMASPFPPCRARRLLFFRTVTVPRRLRRTRAPPHSLISNDKLYNARDMRLNIAKVGAMTNP